MKRNSMEIKDMDISGFITKNDANSAINPVRENVKKFKYKATDTDNTKKYFPNEIKLSVLGSRNMYQLTIINIEYMTEETLGFPPIPI